MTTFIWLSMYIDQHSGGKGNHDNVASGTFRIPFKDWKVGYVLVATRSANTEEEWTIQNIQSPDGKPRREDCTIRLVNKAQEVRELKGSSVQSGYEFKSTGDVEVEPSAVPERTDVKPLAVTVEGIREFYPRNNGEGTRLIMHDKTVYIVLEPFKTIWGMLIEAGVTLGEHRDRSKRKSVDGAMTGAELQGN